jgi:RNA polymerase sigma-70 factor (ECF subfamily)
MPEFDPAGLIVTIATHQDRAAFETLFGHYAPRIKTLMMRRGVSPNAAEDLAQETLIAIWRKASQFDPARATASAWIFAIAGNLRIDSLRRDQRAQRYTTDESMLPDNPDQPDELALINEREQRVRSAIKLLPDEQVQVVRLSFIEGRAHGDIADALKLPLGTVKSRLRLAFRRLRETLGDLT